MRFLCTMTFSEKMSAFPVSVLRQSLMQLRDVINRMKDEGKIIDIYTVTDRMGYVLIIECENGEELYDSINIFPLAGAWGWNIDALTDFNHSLDTTLRNMEQVDDILPGGSVK